MLSPYKITIKMRSHRDFLQNIELSIVIVIFGQVLYSSLIIIAFGISSSPISDNSTLKEAINLTNNGISLNQIGKFNESIVLFNKALVVDPKNILALTETANALVKSGNYQLALIYYDKALAIDPQNAEAIEGKKQALVALNQPR
jgi:tetratricopeptide (TPR) repeat protein